MDVDPTGIPICGTSSAGSSAQLTASPTATGNAVLASPSTEAASSAQVALPTINTVIPAQ